MIYLRPMQDGFVAINYNPFHPTYGLGKTEEELLKDGFLVEEMPIPEIKEGYNPVLKYSEEKGFYFEYLKREKTMEEKIKEQEEQIMLQEGAIAELSILLSTLIPQ